MPRTQVNSIDLYHEVHGQGPAIVFAHGAGGNHLSWWQQVPFFTAHGYTCVTFDQRGFGQSLDGAEGRGASAFPEDLRGLLDHLGLEQAHLVAQSMGGRTALRFATAYPQRVIALVMADTIDSIADDAIRARFRQLRGQEGGGEGQPLLTRRALAPGFPRQRPELAFLYRQIAGLNPPRPSDFTRPRSTAEVVTAETLATMTVPTLFIVGEQDTITPPDLVALAQRLVPNSRLLVVPEAGHSVYYERPDVFNEAVLTFFRAVGGA